MHINGKTKLAGVVGSPIQQSRSPLIHNYWLAHKHINGAYVPLLVAPSDLETALRGVQAAGFLGLNVTAPHKEALMPLMDEIDETVRDVGAVNTIIFHGNGKIEGRNTDVFGFRENLTLGAPDWTSNQGCAVVLGAGGAARAVLVALRQMGVGEIRVVNRSADRAEKLQRDFPNVTMVAWQDRSQALADAGLVVNTTSPARDSEPALDIDMAVLPKAALVTDIVYTPLETPFLAQAKARGNPIIDGLGMLLHQARPGFAAWFGGDLPEVDEDLRRHVLSAA